jgi:hypothetical protein
MVVEIHVGFSNCPTGFNNALDFLCRFLVAGIGIRSLEACASHNSFSSASGGGSVSQNSQQAKC